MIIGILAVLVILGSIYFQYRTRFIKGGLMWTCRDCQDGHKHVSLVADDIFLLYEMIHYHLYTRHPGVAIKSTGAS